MIKPSKQISKGKTMNEKLKTFRKWLQNLSSPLLYGIACIVCGLLLAIFGLGIFDILVWIVGIVVIISGVFKLYLKIRLYQAGKISSFDIIFSCIPIISGIMLMVFKAGVLSSLVNIVALAIFVWAFYRIVKLLIHTPKSKDKEFWYEIVTSCIALIVSILLLVFRGIAELLAGIVLTLVGIELIRAHVYGKKHKYDRNIYDTEFRDITNGKDDGKDN